MALDILSKFSSNLKHTLVRAINLSIRLKHPRVLPLHLLISLGEQAGSIANEIITKNNIELPMLQGHLQRLEWPKNDALYTLPQLSQETVRILEHAAVIAFEHHHKYIGTEHLLLSLVELPDDKLKKMFSHHEINLDHIRKQTLNVLKSTSRFPDLTNVFQDEDMDDDDDMEMGASSAQTTTVERPDAGPESKTPALDFFATDLTQDTIQKTIDPVIGRDKEIERLIHILARRNKNNPVLLGEPGVGKTAIVEGLAKRIIQGKVPAILRNKKIFRLDLGLVVAGTMYRGEFEARFKQITEELKDNPEIIMFIDEIHTLIGAGGTGGNAMDAANILKPSLARGEIRCIGATTLQEYQKHIESDPALERRLQPIMVEEPSTEEAIQVLQGIKKNYEGFHRVRITDDAIVAAVKLSTRYIQDKFLPDKAIDLIDEAAARFRISSPVDPQEKQVADMESKLQVLQKQKLTLVREEKFEEAISLKQKERALKLRLQELVKSIGKQQLTFNGEITDEDIAHVVSQMKGIPLQNLVKSEKERLQGLEATLNQHVIGQAEATKAVADFIKRSRAGLDQPNRPIGSFMFLGPSGVGKTELARTLAKVVYGSADNMIRIDMSEFSEGFTISKLIGAPAGYVGYKEGAKLTDQVKHKPYSLVLFDEIEKAHPDVFNLMLQILDEGHITDATGRKIDFKNTTIIMTSNVGLRDFQEQVRLGFTEEKADMVTPEFAHVKENVLKELKRQFRPEFINRIDKVVVFNPLSLEHLMEIVHLQFADLAKRASEKQITLKISKAAKKQIATLGYTPDEGARAMQRIIQEHIENPLAERILNDTVGAGDTLTVGFQHGDFTFTVTRGKSVKKTKAVKKGTAKRKK